jgi:iron complex transport system substrate-binding protein
MPNWRACVRHPKFTAVRVVSLCPSLTELVFDLGLGESLVGRTKFCVHPVGLVDSVEKVGGTKNPKIDRIVQLAPDVVLLNEEENRLEDAEALRAAGVTCHTSMPRTIAETAAMVRSIGASLGAPNEAARIAQEIETRGAEVAAPARPHEPVRYAYLIWREPWMTVNDDTFVHALLANAGGVNVFGTNAERYPTITLEQLREAMPNAVLLSTEPFPFAQRHIEEVAARTGIARERILIVDGELLSWHGSRTPRGIVYAGETLDAVRAARV